ncbi:GTPase Era [Leptolinea tardivitalis]|uniref:GTPase Era n=1 Tax=Leptolinea tardivitalis TaxID=229920 RepID=A0A0P6X7T2_9CHLR|nr:GTPase Era [Leptolinea tardivitalis]KPL70236.1 GTP-binding protein era [Leptolinea tardivitalis]GAP21782.1 GTP-binding protein Era [Leptolinea tardivitalis]
MNQDTLNYKAGYIALAGRPNVGKSTLVNTIMGQKIAAVSPKPQTTRRRQLGILTLPQSQLIFVDAPGIHLQHHKLGEALNQTAEEIISDVDVIAWVVDGSAEPSGDDLQARDLLIQGKRRKKLVLIVNKIDRVLEENRPAVLERYQSLLPDARPVLVSATTKEGVDELLAVISDLLPVHPPYYDEDEITDLYEREIAADLIREAALKHLREEVPHALAVRVDEFKEREDGKTYVAATLFVERESQKGIVIGQGAEMLKRIGTSARVEMEKMGDRSIFLELRVKVAKGWRDDPDFLRRLGFEIKKKK